MNVSKYFSKERASRIGDRDMEMGIRNTGTTGPESSPQALDVDSENQCRRFYILHRRVLNNLENTIWDLENSPQGPRGSERKNATQSTARRRWVTSIKTELSKFSLMVLSTQSLGPRQGSEPLVRSDQSARDWILHGPMIQFDPSDPVEWEEYKHAVTKLLNDSRHAEWLDWTADAESKDSGCDEGYNCKSICDKILSVAGIIFWICHLTVALAYLLIANPLDSNEKSSSSVALGRWLLGYWYVSTVAIVVYEFLFLDKGYLYLRKIILGEAAALLIAFYVQYMLLHIAAVSAFSSFPLVVSFVLVLIKAM